VCHHSRLCCNETPALQLHQLHAASRLACPQASRPTSSASFLRASSWRTAAPWRTTTSRRVRRHGCLAASAMHYMQAIDLLHAPPRRRQHSPAPACRDNACQCTLSLLQPAESTLHLVLRLRGGSGGATLELRVQPRVQRDKWSLYWKESMATVTDSCQECALEVAAEGETPEYLNPTVLPMLSGVH